MLGISDALELTKKIGDLVKAGATLGLQETIVELREAVMNAKDEVLRLREDNQDLRSQRKPRGTSYQPSTNLWALRLVAPFGTRAALLSISPARPATQQKK